MSGGDVGARNATLTIMVGATEAGFARVKPLLDLLGKNVTHVGPNGAGQTAKVANQIVVALTIEAVAEALLFAAKAGVDPAKVRQALLGGFASSRVLEVHGQRMIERNFEPGARDRAAPEGPRERARGRARDGARPPRHRERAAALQRRARRTAAARWDHSAMLKALELLAGRTVAG